MSDQQGLANESLRRGARCSVWPEWKKRWSGAGGASRRQRCCRGATVAPPPDNRPNTSQNVPKRRRSFWKSELGFVLI